MKKIVPIVLAAFGLLAMPVLAQDEVQDVTVTPRVQVCFDSMCEHYESVGDLDCSGSGKELVPFERLLAFHGAVKAEAFRCDRPENFSGATSQNPALVLCLGLETADTCAGARPFIDLSSLPKD